MVMSGELGVVQVAGLLQLLDRRGRDAVCVHVRTPEDRVGEIYIHGRTVVHAWTATLSGWQAFTTILSWTEGTFVVESRPNLGPPSLSSPLDVAVLKGLSELDPGGPGS